MTEPAIRERLIDEAVLALTMWAEARGDRAEGHSSLEERVAVGCVVRNRARETRQSIKAVCLRPLQFSCWNVGTDPNHLALLVEAEKMLAREPLEPLMRETAYLASGIVSGVILDPTGGATSYYAPAAMRPPGRVPAWARDVEPCARIGSHLFFQV